MSPNGAKVAVDSGRLHCTVQYSVHCSVQSAWPADGGGGGGRKWTTEKSAGLFLDFFYASYLVRPFKIWVLEFKMSPINRHVNITYKMHIINSFKLTCNPYFIPHYYRLLKLLSGEQSPVLRLLVYALKRKSNFPHLQFKEIQTGAVAKS